MTLSEIYNRIKRGKENHILSALLTAEISWTESDDKKILAKILAECRDPFLTLMRTSLIAAYLNSPEKCPSSAARAVHSLIQLEQCGLELSWPEALKANWKLINIPLAGKNKAELNAFLVGHKNGTNSIQLSNTVLDTLHDESLKAVNKSITLANSQCSGIYYCMRVIGPRLFPINGKSLALPLYAACIAAAENIRLPNLALTGNIDTEGNILPVTDLEIKTEKVFEFGYAGLICPGQNLPEAPDIHPARTVEEAILLCKLFSPQISSELKHFLHHLTDPGKSILEIADMSTDCLQVLQNQQPSVIKNCFLDAVYQAPDNVRTMLEKIGAYLEKPNWSMRRLKSFVFLLPQDDEIKQFIDTNPDIAFRTYCIKQILKNHCGELEKNSSSPELDRKMLDATLKINKADFDGIKRNIRYIAGSLVQKRHNAFIFKPDIFAALPCEQQKLFEYAEDEYLKRKKVFMQPNPDLGAFWGTLTQNFAFCGPDYLDKTKEYAWKAWEAFGENDQNGDCKRCLSYLYFACLDAQLTDEAEIYLQRLMPDKNLESPESMGNLSRDPFLALALARWMDETGSRLHGQLKTLKEAAASSEMRHPWQLVLYNIARIDPDLKSARHAAKQSLQYCMEKEAGPPVKAMGLLPLSILHGRKQIPDTTAKDYCQTITSVIEEQLNSTGHFNRLMDKSFKEIMEIIENARHKLFPFTYR